MLFHGRTGSSASHLEWRIRLFGAGAIIGMVGILYDARWMIWVSIGVLVLGFMLRYQGGVRPMEEDDDEEEDHGDMEEEETEGA